MKNFTFLIYFISSISFAQQPQIFPLQWSGDQIKHQQVLELPGLSENQIFDGLKKHLAEMYLDYNKVVNLEDKEMGLISGRAMKNVAVNRSAFWMVFYSFKYEIKPERLRITFENMEVDPVTSSMIPLETFTKTPSGDYRQKIAPAALSVIQNLGHEFDVMGVDLKKKITVSDDW
jgi:hypothetical protein